MFISNFAIKRPIITVVTMLALVVGGIIALVMLQTDEFPDVAPPYVSVAVPYPGASPETVETEVLNPIEEAIASISGVKKVMGKAEDGFAVILIEFNFAKPLPEATQDIRDGISAIRNDLPPEMEEPIIKKLNDTDRPIVSLAIASTRLSPAELTRLADPGITREIRSIPGVAEVTVTGKQERELTVELRPAALSAARVSVAQVVQALQAQNLAAPVGRLQGQFDERSIRLRGRLSGPEEFAQLVVAERNGVLIRLGQVADVRDGIEEQRTLALFNGTESVGIDVKKAKGYSTTDVAEKVLARVRALESTLPAGTAINVVKNSGVRVTAAVRNVQETLFEGALLTVLVVFLFLNSWRSTVITGLALPVSVLASFIAVWAFGFKLETMSLLGLSLAIGILIDDAIVVRENIVRHVELGKDHYTASIEGTDEIGLAVTATTMSILAVFLPVAFMSGIGGQWFKPFALTMACSVAVSLFVSFSLDPMLSAYWPDPHVPPERRKWITRLLDRFNDAFGRMANRYRDVIAWALDHRAAMVVLALGSLVSAFALPAKGMLGFLALVIGLLVVVWGLSGARPFALRLLTVAGGVLLGVGLFRVAPEWRKVGVGFVPLDDRSEFNVAIETPPGSNLAYTRAKTEEADRIIRARPDVLYSYVTLGDPTSGAVDVGQMYVKLVPKTTRALDAEHIGAEVRSELARLGGVNMALFTSDIGGGRKQLALQVKGPDLASINTAAEQIREVVAATPGAVDIALSSKGQRPELTVDLDRGLAGALGVTAGQVAQSLRPAFAGIDAGDWVDPSGETRDVMVRLTPEARRNAADLRQLALIVPGTVDGAPRTVPLGQLVRVSSDLAPAVINHLDRDLVVNVEWNTERRSTGEVMTDVRQGLARLQLPTGVTYSEGGDAENQSEVFGNIFLALGVAVLLMYLILVMQFGSFLDPMAILMSLPLSLVGVMLALAVSGLTINIMSLIGVILLMGIVAKNAILLIDFAKWSNEKGMPIREALIEAGAIRLRPILMTTFALIAGMIPVAIARGEGAQFRQPLGVAVIGGVLTSTFLTLLVIPTVYEIFYDWREALSHRLRGRAGTGVAGARRLTAHEETAPPA
ncbi:MAG TPA: efflux RND transporter permease subunit [Gemmatimonadales bacterium]|nr:efflux RND transporter permease subunit [Gemmatimonadales bacterium]